MSRFRTVSGAAVIEPRIASRSVTKRPALVRVSGELDLAAVPALRHRLCTLDGDVHLECSGLTFIDASGVRLFVAIHQACERRGAKLVLVNPARCLTRLLALTRLDAVLTVRGVSSTR
jgi:anti-sigma B factor antagonist